MSQRICMTRRNHSDPRWVGVWRHAAHFVQAACCGFGEPRSKDHHTPCKRMRGGAARKESGDMQHVFCKRRAAASESRAPVGADFSVSLSNQRIEPQRREERRDRKTGSQPLCSSCPLWRSICFQQRFCLSSFLLHHSSPTREIQICEGMRWQGSASCLAIFSLMGNA